MKFSERYGYVKPAEVLKRGGLNEEAITALCNCYDHLAKWLNQYDVNNGNHYDESYTSLEETTWCFFMNQRRQDFYRDRGHMVAATQFLQDNNNEWYTKFGVRKYGFHGTSHRFINREISNYLKRDDLKVISCHIGSGASICAIKAGKVVDTSMGFSPMTGIMMGTRPGDVDPSVIQYMMDEAGLTIDEIMTDMNKRSGLEGICGKSDSRDVEAGINSGNEMCILAQDMYTWKIANYVAMYNNMLGGADAIVLTAGLGENSKNTRLDILEKLKSLGVKIDLEANDFRGEFRKISSDDSSIPVYVIPTNEELMIALDTYELVK